MITKELLRQVLGFNCEWKIEYAQVNYSIYGGEALELIISGDTLPDDFIVEIADQIKIGNIVCRTTTIDAKIKVVEGE